MQTELKLVSPEPPAAKSSPAPPATVDRAEQLLARAVELLERIAALVAMQASVKPADDRPMPTMHDLAKRLAKDYRTVRRMQQRGLLPAAKLVGREYRFDAAEVDAWLAAGCPSQADWRAMLGEKSR